MMMQKPGTGMQPERIFFCKSAGEKSFFKPWRTGIGMLSAVARTGFGTANKACPAFCMSINKKYIIKVSNIENHFIQAPIIHYFFMSF
jgi:hypothetical protein